MAFATGRRVTLARIKEVTPGTTPASALTDIGVSSGGIRTSLSRLEARRLGQDGLQDWVLDSVTNTITGSGAIVYGGIDWMLEAILQNVFSTDVLVPGTTATYSTFEQKLADITQFLASKAAVMTSLRLNFGIGQIPSYEFTAQGRTPVPAGTTAGSGAYIAAPSTSVLAPSRDIRAILANSVSQTSDCVTAFSIEFTRALFEARGLGSYDACAQGVGSLDIGGSISVHVDDMALFNLYTGDTAIPLFLTVGGATLSQYDFDIASAKLGDGGINPPGGNDEFLTQTYQWRAIGDAPIEITRTPPA